MKPFWTRGPVGLEWILALWIAMLLLPALALGMLAMKTVQFYDWIRGAK